MLVNRLHQTLFPWIYEFNHLVIRHVDHSWLEKNPFYATIQILQPYISTHISLSHLIKQHLPFGSEWILEFNSSASRLLLLDNQSLLYLTRYLGLICVSPAIKKVIDGGALRVLQDMLGLKDFSFLKKSAAFYHPDWLLKTVGLKLTTLQDEQTIERFIQIAGVRCLALLFSQETPEVKRRLAYKLPKSYASELKISSRKEIDQQLEDSFSIYKIIRKLIQDLEIPCQPIFA